MELLISSLVGGFIGLLLSLLFEDQLQAAKKRTLKALRRLFYRPKQLISKPNTFSIGNLITSYLVIDGDGALEYTPETIRCRLEGLQNPLPPEISAAREVIQRREAGKKSQGENYKWNGPLYSLEKYSIGRTIPDENLEIYLSLRQTDYYTFLATIARLDANLLEPPASLTLRQKYLHGHDLSQPVPFLANGFGIAMAVITADKKLILQRRPANAGVRANQLDVSVVEGVHPSLDRADNHKGPDVYRTAIRGAEEELSIHLVQEDIHFLGFGVDIEYYQWGLLGVADCPETAAEMLANRTRGAGGKWEVNEIEAVEVNPKAIFTRLKQEKIWSFGFSAIYYALVRECGQRKVETAAKEIFK